jgi:hypothetical protein
MMGQLHNVNSDQMNSFFFSPDRQATLAVLPTCGKEGEVYEEVNVGEYFHQRLLATRYRHPAAKLEQARTVASAV